MPFRRAATPQRRFGSALFWSFYAPVFLVGDTVPAALQERPDKNGVIRAQWPTAAFMLAVNVFLPYFPLPQP